MSDPTSMSSALAPGVALTSAVIYWANLQNRLGAVSIRVRALNTELRGSVTGGERVASIERQIGMLLGRTRVLHVGVVLAVLTLVAFLGASEVLFIVRTHEGIAQYLFMLGLVTFGLSLVMTLWEMLWARRSLEEDVASSKPKPPAA